MSPTVNTKTKTDKLSVNLMTLIKYVLLMDLDIVPENVGLLSVKIIILKIIMNLVQKP